MSKNNTNDIYSFVSVPNENLNKLEDSLSPDYSNNLELQFNDAPVWENEFFDMIEKKRTVPYVILGHFEFIQVNWIEDNLCEIKDITNKIISKTKQPTNHWDLVKKMIFSGKSEDNEKKTSKELLSKSVLCKEEKNSTFNVYSFFREFISKKKTKQNIEEQSEKNELQYKLRKNLQFLKPLKSIEQSVRKKLNQTKFRTVSRKRINESKLKSYSEKSAQKRNQNLEKKKFLSKKDSDEFSKRILGEKEVSINLNELAASKKFQKLNLVMSKDDGPFMTDYRFILGIEFWSNFCGIEKHQLIAVCPKNFWLKELNSFQSSRILNENQLLKSKRGLFADFMEFLKGSNKPTRSPQRTISSEEKFKLIPYLRLFNPNTDLKKTFHSNTIQDQINKKIKKVYKTFVYLIGGNYPRIRQVGFEEAYEDLLLWVLDTYQAKTRFIALLNDQIKWEIN